MRLKIKKHYKNNLVSLINITLILNSIYAGFKGNFQCEKPDPNFVSMNRYTKRKFQEIFEIF